MVQSSISCVSLLNLVILLYISKFFSASKEMLLILSCLNCYLDLSHFQTSVSRFHSLTWQLFKQPTYLITRLHKFNRSKRLSNRYYRFIDEIDVTISLYSESLFFELLTCGHVFYCFCFTTTYVYLKINKYMQPRSPYCVFSNLLFIVLSSHMSFSLSFTLSYLLRLGGIIDLLGGEKIQKWKKENSEKWINFGKNQYRTYGDSTYSYTLMHIYDYRKRGLYEIFTDYLLKN